MKRIIYFLIILVMVFPLTACFGENDSDPTPEAVIQVPEATYEPTPSMLNGLTGQPPIHTLSSTEKFLEDLDYMLYVMRTNFALFDVAYWAHGVDIYAIIDSAREAVLFNPEMAAEEFFDIFNYKFTPLRSIGHFTVISPALHNSILNEPSGEMWRRFFSDTALGRLRAPNVIAFYESNQPVSLDIDRIMYDLYVRLSDMTEHEIRKNYAFLYNMLTARGEVELAEKFMQALVAADIAEFFRLEMTYLQAVLANNITTRIIEDGYIAYLAIDSFLAYPVPQNEERQIFAFYEEIRDFGHLIIDLRFNGGGAPSWFYRTILEPNIDRSFVMEGFAFFPYGVYTAEYSDISYGTPLNAIAGSLRSMDNYRRDVTNILEVYDLPDLNLFDMERMDYGFRTQTTINPRAHYPRFSLEPTFQGNIWFLTDSHMGSAAEISTWAARETGFATLVGEVTGGNYGGARTVITLPNSGIAFMMDLFYVTDRYGRPFEAGTIPHIFNMDGMDALETVLTLIAVGEY